MADDEAVLVGDTVWPVDCRGPKDTRTAVLQTSGRQRLNIHGAIDLQTDQTRMLGAATVDAASTSVMLMAIEAMYPGKRLIRHFLDNARYHLTKLVQVWLVRRECRIKLHFVAACRPHLNRSSASGG
jgi:hypothetical protein